MINNELKKTRNKQNIIQKIYKILLTEYGHQGWWPIGGKYFSEEENKYEIIIGTILTQNTSWKNVEKALSILRKSQLIQPEKIISIDTDKLADLIKPSGYYNQKAIRLKEVTERIIIYLKKNIKPSKDELLNIRGIGHETADSILLYAYNIPIFVVDTYTKRLLIRLDICDEPCHYKKAQEIFMKNLSKDKKIFNEYHALIVKHGKDVCKKIPLCHSCILKKKGICDY